VVGGHEQLLSAVVYDRHPEDEPDLLVRVLRPFDDGDEFPVCREWGVGPLLSGDDLVVCLEFLGVLGVSGFDEQWLSVGVWVV
jgi:hypothetical protein